MYTISLMYNVTVTKQVCVQACVVAHQIGAYPAFCSMRQPGGFLLLLDGMLVHFIGFNYFFFIMGRCDGLMI